jgi:hypothetical protein
MLESIGLVSVTLYEWSRGVIPHLTPSRHQLGNDQLCAIDATSLNGLGKLGRSVFFPLSTSTNSFSTQYRASP